MRVKQICTPIQSDQGMIRFSHFLTTYDIYESNNGVSILMVSTEAFHDIFFYHYIKAPLSTLLIE